MYILLGWDSVLSETPHVDGVVMMSEGKEQSWNMFFSPWQFLLAILSVN